MADSTSGISNNEHTAPPTGFVITPDDAVILKEYLEEFEHAETTLRTRIVERAMAELYILRPPNAAFDKVQARKVCTILLILSIYLLTIQYHRKLGGGSLTALTPPSASIPNLHANGPPEVSSISSIVMTSFHLQRRHLDLCRVIHSFWVLCRMLPPLYGRLWNLQITMTILKLQKSGLRILHQNIFSPGKFRIIL